MSEDLMEYDNLGPLTPEERPVVRKRKREDEQKVTPATKDRRNFDFFDSVRNAKKLKLGGPTKIADVQLGNCPDGSLEFRVGWRNSSVRETNGYRYFKFLAYDETGSITCSASKQPSDEYNQLIQFNKTYRLTGFIAEIEDPKYNTSGHKYKITIQPSTKLEEVEVTSIPSVTFNFKTFAELKTLPIKSRADFQGVMVQDWGLESRTSINGPFQKRDVTFVDKNGESGLISFMKEMAEDFVFKEFEVVTLGNLMIKEFNQGMEVNVYNTSTMITPAVGEEAIELKAKFQKMLAAAKGQDGSDC